MLKRKASLTQRRLYGAFWLFFGAIVVFLMIWGLRDSEPDIATPAAAPVAAEAPRPKRALPLMTVAPDVAPPQDAGHDPISVVRAMPGASPELLPAVEAWMAESRTGDVNAEE